MTQDDILTVIDTALSTLGLKVERTHEWSAEHPTGEPERVIFKLAIIPIDAEARFRDIPGPQIAADRAEAADGFGIVSVPVGGQEFRVIVDESGRPADPDQLSIPDTFPENDCPDRFPEEGERLQRLAESHTIQDAGPPEPQPDDPMTLHGFLPGAEALLKPCDIESLPVRRGRLRVVDGGTRG